MINTDSLWRTSCGSRRSVVIEKVKLTIVNFKIAARYGAEDEDLIVAFRRETSETN